MKVHLQSPMYPEVPRCMQFTVEWLKNRWKEMPPKEREAYLTLEKSQVTCKRCLKIRFL